MREYYRSVGSWIHRIFLISAWSRDVKICSSLSLLASLAALYRCTCILHHVSCLYFTCVIGNWGSCLDPFAFFIFILLHVRHEICCLLCPSHPFLVKQGIRSIDRTHQPRDQLSLQCSALQVALTIPNTPKVGSARPDKLKTSQKEKVTKLKSSW